MTFLLIDIYIEIDVEKLTATNSFTPNRNSSTKCIIDVYGGELQWVLQLELTQVLA